MPQVSVRKPETILHLGAGNDRRLGPSYPEARIINVDADPTTGPDVVCDVRRLPFANESVDWSLARHVLEHIPWPQALVTMMEWARVLKPTGVVKVVVPDMASSAKKILEEGMTLELQSYIFGSQANNLQRHNAGFTAGILAGLVKQVGLDIIDYGEQNFHLVLSMGKSEPRRETMKEIYVVGRKKENNILQTEEI